MVSGSNEFARKTGSNGLTIRPTGNTTISGILDVGSGSSSRIRSHAANNGYTGYAELNAASGWDMWINLETTYPNGGWVCFKINNDSHMQLPGSDNKVNIYKGTSINCNLDVGKDDVMRNTTI